MFTPPEASGGRDQARRSGRPGLAIMNDFGGSPAPRGRFAANSRGWAAIPASR